MLRGERLLPKGGEHQSVDTATWVFDHFNQWIHTFMFDKDLLCYLFILTHVIYGKDITVCMHYSTLLFTYLSLLFIQDLL